LKEKIQFKRRGRLRSGNVELMHDNTTPLFSGKNQDLAGKIQMGSIATSII